MHKNRNMTRNKDETTLCLENLKLYQDQAYKNEITQQNRQAQRGEMKSIFVLKFYLISQAQQIPSREEARCHLPFAFTYYRFCKNSQLPHPNSQFKSPSKKLLGDAPLRLRLNPECNPKANNVSDVLILMIFFFCLNFFN